MLVGIIIWAASIAIFLGRKNSWPWAIVKGSLLNFAIWGVIFFLIWLGGQVEVPW